MSFRIHHTGFEISALQFHVGADLGCVTASFLLWFKDSGLSLQYTRYMKGKYKFERSAIENIFWNDSFNISNKELKYIIRLNKSIKHVLEQAYQMWLKCPEYPAWEDDTCQTTFEKTTRID